MIPAHETPAVIIAALIIMTPLLIAMIWDFFHFTLGDIYAKWHMNKYGQKSKYWPTGRVSRLRSDL